MGQAPSKKMQVSVRRLCRQRGGTIRTSQLLQAGVDPRAVQTWDRRFFSPMMNKPRSSSMRSPRAVFASMLAFAVFAATPASAIIMRHDKESGEYERLAESYVEPLVWIRFRDSKGLVVSEGTLVADRWVLTAAHVVEEMQRGATVIYGGETYRVAKVHQHPDWTGKFEEMHDIALLRLQSPVTHAKPARLYRRSDEDGKEIVVVGRGMWGTGLTGPRNDDQKLRAATNRIKEVGPKHLSFDFDAPDSNAATGLEGISGPGDSGGPAILMEDGTLFVVGVSSAQDDEPTRGREGRYGVREYYTRVSAFADWIDKTIRENAEDKP